MTNAHQIGQRMIAMSTEVVASIEAEKNRISEALNQALQGVGSCKDAAERPTSEVVAMLGETHPGSDAVIGNSAGVVEALNSVYGAIQQAVAQLNIVSSAATTLGFVYNNVGTEVAGRG
jgi:ABC-type transporter Mla subunit MlaD